MSSISSQLCRPPSRTRGKWGRGRAKHSQRKGCQVSPAAINRDWCVIARLHDTEGILETDRGGVSWRSSAVSTPSLALATASKDSEQRPTER